MVPITSNSAFLKVSKLRMIFMFIDEISFKDEKFYREELNMTEENYE